ncbi:MAG TPA: C39 family peptidase [Candidatus Avoscillospira avistercoris]|uniref:C39 family peptidase n=1 Tax=Candidatus Avoscillospira avistercoris TaxID=2840707 RepID=A0A9D1F7P4_9FIRM|nr:C39 family peptidase [Candidatus Avoscillospira avistercoris]
MKGRRKTVLKIAAVLCLATVCIGGVELAVCRFAAPDLYRRITTPVVAAAHRVGDAGSAILDEAVQAGHALVTRISAALKPEETETPPPTEEEGTTEPEEPMESQLAEAPAVDDHRPIEDPAVTELSEQNGLEVLTGGSADFVYYCQSEAPWADAPYGPDHIGGYGCGPTAMAMVVSTLSGTVVDPAQMAQWAYENGYCAPGSGSYHDLIPAAAQAWGLEGVIWEDRTADSILSTLASGKIFVALMGPGHFTAGGHFIILRGVTLDGRILVSDPNSRQRSLTAWEPSLIIDELSSSRNDGAPLWCITSPEGKKAF